MMTNRQINALAAFIADGRPDWQPPGIVAALRHDRDHTDPWQLAAAIIRRASDPANTTPRLQPFDHNNTQRMTCRTHPSAGTRTDGECGGCWADRNATTNPPPHDRGGTPPAPDVRAKILTAIHTPPVDQPKPRRPKPAATVMATVRAELDQARAAQATDNAHTTPDEATR